MGAATLDVELGELAVFIAFGDSGDGQEGLGSGLQAAVATGNARIWGARNFLPTGSFTNRANFCRNLHEIS